MRNDFPWVIGGDGGTGKLRDLSERCSPGQWWGFQVPGFSVSLPLFLYQVRLQCVFPNFPNLCQRKLWNQFVSYSKTWSITFFSQRHGKQTQMPLISQAKSIPIASAPLHRCQTSCGRNRKWALHYVHLLGKSQSRKTTFGIFFLFSVVSQIKQQVSKIVMNNH